MKYHVFISKREILMSIIFIVVLGTVFLVIGIIIAYIRIEGKYRIK